MIKKMFAVFSILISMLSINVRAIELNEVERLVVKEEKYYKTVSANTSSNLLLSNSSSNLNSFTVEVSKEEYDNFVPVYSIQGSITETTYKKMTTSIYKSGTKYRYQVELNWKNIPKTRSYDIIGVGFLNSVKATSVDFINKYCISSSECKTYSDYSNLYQASNGVGIMFKLPAGTLTSLYQKLSVTIEKNTTAKIIKQIAYGDYSHATSSVSLSNAKKYLVNNQGIVLNEQIKGYYDEINVADATWTGSW